MATLGNSTYPSGGVWTDQRAASTQWITGPWTMPAPGGTITDMYLGIGPDGNSNCDFCIWFGSTLQYHDTNHFLGQLQSQHLSGLSLWCPGGTQVYLGMWQADTCGIEWEVGDSGGVTFQTASSPSNRSGGGDEYGGGGEGAFQAYVAYTPLPAPTISGVSPDPAPVGTNVTITGTAFLHTTSVTIGGVSAAFTVNSDTSITATVPSGVSGSVSVVVTNPAGSASFGEIAGEIYFGDPSGNGTVHTLVAIFYGDPSGNGTVHQMTAVWVPNGQGGVKRIW